MPSRIYEPGIEFPVAGQPGAVMVGPRINITQATTPQSWATAGTHTNDVIVPLPPFGEKDLLLFDFLSARLNFSEAIAPAQNVTLTDYTLAIVDSSQNVALSLATPAVSSLQPVIVASFSIPPVPLISGRDIQQSWSRNGNVGVLPPLNQFNLRMDVNGNVAAAQAGLTAALSVFGFVRVVYGGSD